MHKTAYDMRMSDWSSDVCSSDLSMYAAFGLSRPDIESARSEGRTPPLRPDPACLRSRRLCKGSKIASKRQNVKEPRKRGFFLSTMRAESFRPFSLQKIHEPARLPQR